MEFGFAEDFAAGLLGEGFEADEGGVADCWEDGLAGGYVVGLVEVGRLT